MGGWSDLRDGFHRGLSTSECNLWVTCTHQKHVFPARAAMRSRRESRQPSKGNSSMLGGAAPKPNASGQPFSSREPGSFVKWGPEGEFDLTALRKWLRIWDNFPRLPGKGEQSRCWVVSTRCPCALNFSSKKQSEKIIPRIFFHSPIAIEDFKKQNKTL